MSPYEYECKCVCVGGGFVCLPGRWTSGEASTSASAAAVTLSSFGWRWRRRQLLFMALLLLLILLHATALNNCYFAIAFSICYLATLILLGFSFFSHSVLFLCFGTRSTTFFLFALNKIWTLIKIWSHSPTCIYTVVAVVSPAYFLLLLCGVGGFAGFSLRSLCYLLINNNNLTATSKLLAGQTNHSQESLN